ncbi:MAG: PocR ligand-binding domain-containing protein [Desulfobacterales bacterium]|jgi:ligand-binding sensor protein|nr:PocR ligand-binding domain-containing protein [Desulfobacterales bacterium]MDH3827465.1 PocR ligand-binding domain-containing protein [Desulfobacterales bacterium]MDH4010104.1 PocR ligand-binding domain-containing protein [Desulfobacterales bacterium]
MKLTDIAPLDRWLELEQKINERSGLNASVFNVDGVRITDFKRWANKLCPVIKADEKGQNYICAVAHQNIAAEAERSRKPVIAECDAGLMKMVVPIFANDAFLGVAGGCGYVLGDGEVDTFMVNKTIGLAEEKLKNLSDDVPVMTPEQAQSLTEFIQNEVGQILNAYENTA